MEIDSRTVSSSMAHDQVGSFLNDPAVNLAPSTELGPLSEKEGSVIGPYKLLQKIGEGGFGIVYMAEQTKPILRRVALKIIKLGMDTKQVVGRFEAERQALAMMDHPNIAKVLEAGATETGRPYFVMELVRGLTVTEYCDQANVSIKGRLKLFMLICQAVQHAHQKGIIHRDLKPSNVLVTLHDEVPIPKVIDFGIAKATQHRLTNITVFTQFRQFVGTPAYMSPEQAGMSDLDIDTRSDIYSLGVLLYELLTGKPPFDGKQLLREGVDAMRRRLRDEEPPRASTAFSTLTEHDRVTVARRRRAEPAKLSEILRGDVDWIIMKAMEKDRSRRYETASAFRLDLERFLNGEPVEAVAPSPFYKVRKFAKRHRAAMVTGLGIAALLFVSSVVTSVFGVREYRASKAKEKALALAEANAREARLQQYVSDVKTAQVYIDDGNLQAARERLRACLPIETNRRRDDLRGIEWYYLAEQAQGDHVSMLEGHTDRVIGLSFGEGGKRLLSTGRDRTVRVWDWESREQDELYHFTGIPQDKE
jgi:eukaryotic-like serine/threonine-protein kinase